MHSPKSTAGCSNGVKSSTIYWYYDLFTTDRIWDLFCVINFQASNLMEYEIVLSIFNITEWGGSMKNWPSTWTGSHSMTDEARSYSFHLSHLIHTFRTSYIVSSQMVGRYCSWVFTILNCWYVWLLLWCGVVVVTLSINDEKSHP